MRLSDFASACAHTAAHGLEIVGVATIVLGTIAATALFLSERGRADFYEQFRTRLGRAILLGLEFLVAADIFGTVAVEPTYRSLGILAIIVLIRTFLSFSLEVEINGRWPWGRGEGPAQA